MRIFHTSEQMTEDAREMVVNQLYDLQHDLAKYIRMPLTFLPSHATDTDLRDALRRALQETYRRGSEIVAADSLWREFLAELPLWVRQLESFARLESAVTRALAWEHSVDDHDSPLDRREVLGDFGAISAAIDLLIVDVEAEGAVP